MNYRIQDREAGNVIEYFETLREAQQVLYRYEREDKEAGNYTEDFYEIAVLVDGQWIPTHKL
jgi:hypothetical protein